MSWQYDFTGRVRSQELINVEAETLDVKKLALVLLLIVPLGAAQQPENVTVELEFGPSNAYIDGQEYENTEITRDPSSEYISTGQPLGIVSYGEIPLAIGFVDSERYYVTQNISRNSTEFLLPFTSDGPNSIERRRTMVQNGELMNQLNPAFSFSIGAERIIRVSYPFGYRVAEFIGPETGIEEILVRNRIHSGNQTELTLRTE